MVQRCLHLEPANLLPWKWSQQMCSRHLNRESMPGALKDLKVATAVLRSGRKGVLKSEWGK